MDTHGGGRFPPCASRGQARLEKPIERPCDRNHRNDFETRFFQEVGRPVAADAFPRPPFEGDVRRFAEVAARYGHWLASPQENAAVGIKLL
jgi:hypothetical protein